MRFYKQVIRIEGINKMNKNEIEFKFLQIVGNEIETKIEKLEFKYR